jgi:hypothetical protein
MRFSLRISAGVLTALAVAGVAMAQQVDPLDSSPFTSDIVCGRCHKDIHDAWLTNRHSQASTNPVFLKAMEEAGGTLQERARPFCLMCHAPTTTLTRDYAMERNITKEGVTCDFCHSMVESRPGETLPFRLEVSSNIKHGPYKDADSSEHPVAYSELHVSAEICASCHEYKTPSGAAVLSTYSEYLEGPYPSRRIPCQGCHMPIVMANVVDPKVKRDPRNFINLHRMPGGHAVDQLRRGLDLEWDEVRREPGRLLVRVAVANVAAGHRFPTGLPTRKLVLEVEARPVSGRVYQERMVYRKVVVDEAGIEVVKDGEMFTRPARVRSDNRIRPGERRVEGFYFPVSTGEEAQLTARLAYEYQPFGTAESAVRTVFATIEQTHR